MPLWDCGYCTRVLRLCFTAQHQIYILHRTILFVNSWKINTEIVTFFFFTPYPRSKKLTQRRKYTICLSFFAFLPSFFPSFLLSFFPSLRPSLLLSFFRSLLLPPSLLQFYKSIRTHKNTDTNTHILSVHQYGRIAGSVSTGENVVLVRLGLRSMYKGVTTK